MRESKGLERGSHNLEVLWKAPKILLRKDSNPAEFRNGHLFIQAQNVTAVSVYLLENVFEVRTIECENKANITTLYRTFFSRSN
jgi:hypothetical protein